MGLFNREPKLPTKMRELRQGTEIPLVDVDPGFVDWARSNKPREPRIGHVVKVRVDLVNQEIQVRAGDGSVVGRMDPKFVPLYIEEFNTLRSRGQYGVTDAHVKWDGSKSAHSLALNWGVGAFDGGVL